MAAPWVKLMVMLLFAATVIGEVKVCLDPLMLLA